MEYCELGDLALFIKKRDKLITHPATCDLARKYPSVPGFGLNEVVIRHFLKQLASALQFLRQGNFVHRDIKPQNLLLLPSVAYRESNKESRPILSASQDSLIPAVGLQSLPMLKLADFGFARVLPSTSLAETLCGSPLYMAPEILRYERYDAKADLWSVGTVAFEMIVGKPPFRANNHVELLRKIEGSNDYIKFPKESQVASGLKSLIRALLKRKPVERMNFEDFFNHTVIADPIPGLVEDDLPRSQRPPSRDYRTLSKTDEPHPERRRLSIHHRYRTDTDVVRQEISPSSPRERHSRHSPLSMTPELQSQPQQTHGNSPIVNPPQIDTASGLGIQRSQPVSPTSAPPKPVLADDYGKRGYSNPPLTKFSRDDKSPGTPYVDSNTGKGKGKQVASTVDEQEKAAHDIAFERDYVVVEKRHVEVNAFADELAAKGTQTHAISPRSGQVVRRGAHQGDLRLATGAIPAQTSNALQITQGRQRSDNHNRGSYEKGASGSPSSTTSVISKAIQDASLRLFGFRYPSHMLGKGASPPHLYSPFPTYPTPSTPVALITDGRQGGPIDEDLRVAQCIEDFATRSDVVWGFAEVKYKQLVPLAPSIAEGLGGILTEKMGSEDEEGLTIEAIVVLSEEALVLYVKALSLLAKSMDIASIWWTRKAKGESTSNQHIVGRDAASAQNLVARVNSAVQWVRKRFNETLEKAEIVRLKLTEAQKHLPEDHFSHPNNNIIEAVVPGTPSTEGIILTPGLSAERLMYDRAIDMSRTAAINEIANEDLSGCELSYVTAIRMLEAVLDNDEDFSSKRRLSGSPKLDHEIQEASSEINPDDQQAVHKMIHMITGRLATLRGKMQMITHASKAQQHSLTQHNLARTRSDEITPRSVPTHTS
ncbi:Serine/threonine-protein kinase ATG1 [Xylaria intraflava]|nr:Serine/threonine-protein kinase ATG1 [Xylaria intraflava]